MMPTLIMMDGWMMDVEEDEAGCLDLILLVLAIK